MCTRNLTTSPRILTIRPRNYALQRLHITDIHAHWYTSRDTPRQSGASLFKPCQPPPWPPHTQVRAVSYSCSDKLHTLAARGRLPAENPICDTRFEEFVDVTRGSGFARLIIWKKKWERKIYRKEEVRPVQIFLHLAPARLARVCAIVVCGARSFRRTIREKGQRGVYEAGWEKKKTELAYLSAWFGGFYFWVENSRSSSW